MSVTRLKVSGVALRCYLQLPEDTRLVFAHVEDSPGGSEVLALDLDIPGAPDEAAAVEPMYTTFRNQGQPGGLFTLAGLRWLRGDGTEITEPASQAGT